MELVGPGYNNLDMSLFKNFAVTERATFQFRAEAFNLANTPQFVNPDNNFTDPNFGALQTTRLGSERQLQFALKFIF